MTPTEVSAADVHHHQCEAMVALSNIIDDVGPDGARDLLTVARLLTRSAEYMVGYRPPPRAANRPPAPPALPR